MVSAVMRSSNSRGTDRRLDGESLGSVGFGGEEIT
jgi:hypothetical protein